MTTTTPLGDFHFIVERQEDEEQVPYDIVRASGFGQLHTLKTRLPEELQNIECEEIIGSHSYKDLITAYFNGDRNALANIPYKQEGSEFNHNVWRAISNVGYGKTSSYKELALASGNPAAIRAAGTVCGTNRLILLVPCHRILKSDGSIGQYLYGSEIKKFLLDLEQKS